MLIKNKGLNYGRLARKIFFLFFFTKKEKEFELKHNKHIYKLLTASI